MAIDFELHDKLVADVFHAQQYFDNIGMTNTTGLNYKERLDLDQRYERARITLELAKTTLEACRKSLLDAEILAAKKGEGWTIKEVTLPAEIIS